MQMPAPNALHDQKSHVAPPFSYLKQMHVVLTMPLALHVADAGANGITWPPKSCCVSFWSSSYNKCSGAIIWHWHQYQWYHIAKNVVAHCCSHLKLMKAMVLLTMTLASHDADVSANSVKWLKKSWCTSFQPSWHNKMQHSHHINKKSYWASFQIILS